MPHTKCLFKKYQVLATALYRNPWEHSERKREHRASVGIELSQTTPDRQTIFVIQWILCYCCGCWDDTIIQHSPFPLPPNLPMYVLLLFSNSWSVFLDTHTHTPHTMHRYIPKNVNMACSVNIVLHTHNCCSAIYSHEQDYFSCFSRPQLPVVLFL